MMKYSVSTKGFYDPLHPAVPADAQDIPDELYLALLAAQETGKVIEPIDGIPVAVDPPPLSPEQLLAQYRAAVQSHIDLVAAARGYDSGTSCASYAGSKVLQWEAEAAAFILWRDAVWQQVLGLFAEVQAGTAAIPALEDLIADLPTIDWPA